MTLRAIFRAWNDFFFKEEPPSAIALFRIFYGLLVIATLIQLRPYWLTWYGSRGWVSMPTALSLEPGTRFNLFSIISGSDRWIDALFWVSLVSAGLLTIGLLTSLNSVLVFLCLTSIQERNLFITHGGDTFLRLAGFFLIFAPAGAVFSVDRWMRVRHRREPNEVRPRSPWAQRMIQLQLALLYVSAFLAKIKGAPWLQGSALFYIYHLEEFRRFPLPTWFFHPVVLKLGSWSALALEFSLGVLVWVREFRYPLLTLGVLFHLWLEYSLNIPLFQWEVLSAYVLFVDPRDLSRAHKWFATHSRQSTAISAP
jgi:Vitamin K-dependent gamma-carboxylase